MKTFVLYDKARGVNREAILLSKSLKLDRYKQDQLIRASNSMVLNIAEGNGRFTKKDKLHYFVTARGSLQETMALFDLMEDEGLLDKERADELRENMLVVLKMLTKLIMNLSGK